MKSRALCVHFVGLARADFGHDPHSSKSCTDRQVDCMADNTDGVTVVTMPMTHAPETGARKLASVSGGSFSRQLQNFWCQKPTRTNKK